MYKLEEGPHLLCYIVSLCRLFEVGKQDYNKSSYSFSYLVAVEQQKLKLILSLMSCFTPS